MQHTYLKPLCLVLLSASTLFLGCGDNSGDNNSAEESEQVCTDEELAQPAEDCLLSEHVVVEEPADLRPLCESPCSNGDELWLQIEGPVQNLRPLSRLKNILQLDVKEGADLENLKGLENLESVKNLFIDSNEDLESLDGLEGLRTAEGDVRIAHNASLKSTEGLDNLKSARSLTVSGNPKLMDLGFDALSELGSLIVTSNDELSPCNVDALAEQIEDLTSFDNEDNGGDESCE